MWPFAMQKTAKCSVKDALLQADMPCFAAWVFAHGKTGGVLRLTGIRLIVEWERKKTS
jgi:hypothetical protein